MRLAHAPLDISLGAVVRSIEPDFLMVECFSTANTCVLTGACKVTGVIDGALRSFMDHLDGHSLADILPMPDDFAATQVVRLMHPAPAPVA